MSKNNKEINDKTLSLRKKEAIKAFFTQELKQTPIIQSVCQKLNINRATIYRWFREDRFFKENCNYSITEGNNIVNDIAKHNLIKRIKNDDYKAIIYYLSRRHPEYIDNYHDYKITDWWQFFRDEKIDVDFFKHFFKK